MRIVNLERSMSELVPELSNVTLKECYRFCPQGKLQFWGGGGGAVGSPVPNCAVVVCYVTREFWCVCLWWLSVFGRVHWVGVDRTKSLKVKVDLKQSRTKWYFSKVREGWRESEDMQTRQMCLKSPAVCLDPRASSIDSSPPPLCVSVAPYMLHLWTVYSHPVCVLSKCSPHICQQGY